MSPIPSKYSLLGARLEKLARTQKTSCKIFCIRRKWMIPNTVPASVPPSLGESIKVIFPWKSNGRRRNNFLLRCSDTCPSGHFFCFSSTLFWYYTLKHTMEDLSLLKQKTYSILWVMICYLPLAHLPKANDKYIFFQNMFSFNLIFLLKYQSF